MQNSFKVKLTAACRIAVAAVIVVTMSGAGTAQTQGVSESTEQCSPLFRTSSGRQVNASYSAHRYSQENVGAVGISIFPGRTLSQDSAHDLGHKLVNMFKQNDVEARCFVHYDNGAKGSGFNFKITGLSWKKDGPMNIVEATSETTLRGVIAEAKTARALLLGS